MGLQRESSGGREQVQPQSAGNGIRETVHAGSITGEWRCVTVPSAGPGSALDGAAAAACRRAEY